MRGLFGGLEVTADGFFPFFRIQILNEGPAIALPFNLDVVEEVGVSFGQVVLLVRFRMLRAVLSRRRESDLGV